MKAICAGTRTKNDVVHETLEKYQEMYMRTVGRLDVLKLVSRLRLCFMLMITEIFSLSVDMSLASKTCNDNDATISMMVQCSATYCELSFYERDTV